MLSGFVGRVYLAVRRHVGFARNGHRLALTADPDTVIPVVPAVALAVTVTDCSLRLRL